MSDSSGKGAQVKLGCPTKYGKSFGIQSLLDSGIVQKGLWSACELSEYFIDFVGEEK